MVAVATRPEEVPTPAALSARDIPALDGVRGVAVLLVIWSHLRGLTLAGPWHWIQLLKDLSGFVGLYLFFVLSGFLLFLPYARALVAGTVWPSTWRFYQRRMLRILPVYYAVLSVPLLLALYARVTHAGGALSPGTLVPNLLLLQDLNQRAWAFIMYFDTPLWSLAVEWQYYLVLPLLALGLRLMHRRGGTAWVIVGLLGLMGYGLLVRTVAALTFYQWGYANVLQVPRPAGLLLMLTYGMNGKFLEVFALGMLASLGYVMITATRRADDLLHRRNGAPRHITLAHVTSLVPAVALLGVLANLVFMLWTRLIPIPMHAALGRWPQEAPFAWAWGIAGPWLISVSTTGLIVGALLGPTWLRQIWAWGALRRVGLISYSLYVWHALLQDSWDAFWSGHLAGRPDTLRLVTYLALLAIVGTLSYLVIERPFMRVRRRVGRMALA
jgi:peptidoglycan/LPS O-acetylase OafA/YrhL